jgi:hypothetical protein
MAIGTWIRRGAQAVPAIAHATMLGAMLALPGFSALARPVDADDSTANDARGMRVQIDNDLFAGRERDRDYTGGMGITISGAAAREGWLSLDPVLAWADALALAPLDEPAAADDPRVRIHHARQVGLMAFTPADTLRAEAQFDDRPYASLLFLSNGRVRVDDNDRDAWSSSVTIGVLGLRLSQRLHGAVHELVGSERPQGYDHQISAGGEPTARYTLARHRLLLANPAGNLDVKTTVQGSVGYLTEASAAISVRAGRFDTPWWSFAPELTDYMAAPVPVERGHGLHELYVFFGARIKARVYDAFLQGQFRHSDVRYSIDEIRPVIAEAWIGVATRIFGQTQLSYTLNYQTAELREGEAARDALWGGVQLAHVF